MLHVASRRARRKLPTPFWDNRPQPKPHLSLAWECFTTLSLRRRRDLEGNPLRIDVSEVLAWLDIYRIEGSSREWILKLVCRIDDDFFAKEAAKRASPPPTDSPEARGVTDGDRPDT